MAANLSIYEQLRDRIASRQARAGIIGLGYVGLPLAITIARSGFAVTGFDIDPGKVAQLNGGSSYIEAVTDAALEAELAGETFRATADFAELAQCDVIIICVPTPLTKHREPDLSFIRNTTEVIATHLRAGQLVALESTTYPGTTREVVKVILAGSGLEAGIDFFVGFSPEREDPGNRSFQVSTIPKIVAGDGQEAATLMKAFYGSVVETIVPVSTTDTAEAVKLTENIFRAVNIALVNELKVLFDAMGIDVWEVINAAKSKPFGYMPFYPGPGLGGHCVPIDPFYLTWKAREFELSTRFIELAGEINSTMPRYVVTRLAEALDIKAGKALSRSRVLIIGLAYKKNVPDIRESPSLKLIELIEERGGTVEFHDPFIAEIPPTREYGSLKGRKSVALNAKEINGFDAVLIATDHDNVDYCMIAEASQLVVDTRNVMGRLELGGDRIVKA